MDSREVYLYRYNICLYHCFAVLAACSCVVVVCLHMIV
jgi:hypothetical protein